MRVVPLTNSRLYFVMQVFAALQHDQVQADPLVDGQPAQPVIEAQALVLNQAAIDEWEKREINARAMILFNVDDDQQVSIRGCRTAMETWDQLNMEP